MENMFPTESGNSSPPKRGRSLLTTNQDELHRNNICKIKENKKTLN